MFVFLSDIICDMIIILDTNVLVAGLISSAGASFQILKNIPEKRFAYLLSVPLFLEYEAVLKRSAFLKMARLMKQEIDIILDNIAEYSTKTNIYYLWRPHLSDPQDDMVLELAVSGNADAIVTFNKKDFQNVQSEFGINIITPAEFLISLKGKEK